MATARQKGSDYSLQVKLLELHAKDPKTIRLYQKPSEMNMFPESTLIKNADEFFLYGISERRTEINHPIQMEDNEARVASNFKKLEDDERYKTPDFISNLNSLKYLMAPERFKELFKATKCPGTNTIDIRIVLPRWFSEGPSSGFVLDRMLCTTPATAGESQQFYGHFHTSLGKPAGEEEITFAYTAQLDGLEFSEDRKARLTNATSSFRFTADDFASIVEVKAINTKRLCSKVNLKESSISEPYTYEQKFLRGNWAQCQLSGLKTLLCGIVGFEEDEAAASDLKLKEVWNCEFKKFPEIVQRRVLSTDGWQGRFPSSILTNSEKERFEQNIAYAYMPWSEQQILYEFYTALTEMKNEMRNSSDSVKYFIYTKKSGTTGGRLMRPIATSWNQKLDRINASIWLRVPVPDDQTGVRRSVQDILSDLAATEDPDLGFLTDWLRNINCNLLVSPPRRGFESYCSVKLDFQSEEEAAKVLRAVKVKGIHGWGAHASTLEKVLRESSHQWRRRM